MVKKILTILGTIATVPEIMKKLPEALTVISKIIPIIKGWFCKIFNKNKELANERIAICEQCEHIEHIDIVGDICAKCGCVLSAKARVKDEHCILNKW